LALQLDSWHKSGTALISFLPRGWVVERKNLEKILLNLKKRQLDKKTFYAVFMWIEKCLHNL
jgi:hypothetical protein